MDYGKEAYFKIGELERLIGNNQGFGVSGMPYKGECPSGRKTAVATYAGGSALMIVSATSTGSGGIDIYFGGMRVSGLASGGTATAIFTVTDGGDIELFPATDVNVTDVYVSAFGNKCGFEPNTVRVVADSNGNETFAALASDRLEAFRLDGSVFVSVYRAAKAVDFDIACSDKGTLLAYIDGDNYGVLTLIDGSRSAVIGNGYTKIAVTAVRDGWAVAAYNGSEVTVTRYDGNLTPLECTTVRVSKTVVGVCFIKHADALSLIASDGTRNILCVSSDEAHTDVTAKVTLEIAY